MLQEECAEVIVAVNKLFRAIPSSYEYASARIKLASEIADVEIMCAQVRLILGNVSVDTQKEDKLIRLQQTLKNYKAKKRAAEKGKISDN